jgi:hypothetical protein
MVPPSANSPANCGSLIVEAASADSDVLTDPPPPKIEPSELNKLPNRPLPPPLLPEFVLLALAKASAIGLINTLLDKQIDQSLEQGSFTPMRLEMVSVIDCCT